MRIMGKLLARGPDLKLDGILIETTGLADPAPVAQTFFVDEDIKAKARRFVLILKDSQNLT